MFNIKQIFNKTYEYLIIIITLILILIIVIANVFIVGPSEEAIVLRLGKLTRRLVQYKIRDPYSFKFKVEDPETTIKDIAKSSMNRLIGDNTIFEIINDNRVGVTEGVKSSMNEIIDNYNLGIDVVQVQIRNALPPKGKVYEAFEDVNIAIQDKNKYINEGRKEFNQIVPKIKGEALKVIEEARGYKESRINKY